MLEIPLYIFLAAYGLYLIFFFLFSAANVYHIYATGTFTLPVVIVTLIVSTWCIAVLGATMLLLSGTNWQSAFTLFGGAPLISF